MIHRISITLTEGILQNIERDKGLISRSKFIEKLLELGYTIFEQQEKNIIK